MSQIFDALQRSEKERLGEAVRAASAATELLQRAERTAATEWESGVVEGSPAAIDCSDGEPAKELQATADITHFPEVVPPTPSSQKRETCPYESFRRLKDSSIHHYWMVGQSENESPAAEAFRLLGVRLKHRQRDGALKKILITSTIPEEGKSMVAANLACTLAKKTQQAVLLLEGDLRRPALSHSLDLDGQSGLSECLESGTDLKKCILHLAGSGLCILPAGGSVINPLELVQSAKLSAIMQQLNQWFDWIIIDSPPILPLADTSIWARIADGILLITRRGVTRRRQLLRGIEAIDSKKLIGAVLNSAEHPEFGDYYYRRYAVKSSKESQKNH
jgi:capsular exopolysaccharide synthesis family protein